MPLTSGVGQMQAIDCGDKPLTNENFDAPSMRPNIWRITGWSLVTLLLLLPLVAMQFTSEVAWSGSDFAFAAALLIGSGVAVEICARSLRGMAYNVAAGIALIAVLLLVWLNGAVGIIGDEANPLNLLYWLVAAIALVGAGAARLRARGMARALAAAAASQAAVSAIAVFDGAQQHRDLLSVALLNGFFLALLTASAYLFRGAAKNVDRR